MNYEKRLLKFLKDNPKLLVTTNQIAGIWKRSKQEVHLTAMYLFEQGKVSFKGPQNFIKLNMCEGIGGA